MSQGNDPFQLRRIYHRLITFFSNHLIVQGRRKVTLGGAAAAAAMPAPVDESIEVPIIGSSRNMKIMPSKTGIGGNGVFNNEIVIDFRHIDEEPSPAEMSSSFRKLSSRVNVPITDPIPAVAQGKETGGRRQQQQQQQRSADSSNEGKRKDHNIEKYSNQKDRDIRTDPPSTTGNRNSGEAKMKHVSRSRGSRPPLMSVDSNINEKADAFIRSRKEAMKKNFGHGN